jgi:hypothetical protein
VRFAAFLYSRKLIVNRAGSTEPRELVNEARTPRVLRGFSPHLVADDDITNGCCGRFVRDRGPLDTSARPRFGAALHAPPQPVRSHHIALRACAHRAARRSYPLLHPRTGRHDLDEAARGTTLRLSASRHAGDIAVKNLRIIGSAVLLLNFRGVGSIHLCSTGVTV